MHIIQAYSFQYLFYGPVLPSERHAPPVYAPSATGSASSIAFTVAVCVIVDVVVRVLTTELVTVLLTVVSAGPFVMKHEHAELISRGLPRPREMVTPVPGPMVMSSWRLRTGSSVGQSVS